MKGEYVGIAKESTRQDSEYQGTYVCIMKPCWYRQYRAFTACISGSDDNPVRYINHLLRLDLFRFNERIPLPSWVTLCKKGLHGASNLQMTLDEVINADISF